MAEGIRQVAELEDPVGEVLSMKQRPNGLMIGKKRVPLGVIGIIYESRPNVTADLRRSEFFQALAQRLVFVVGQPELALTHPFGLHALGISRLAYSVRAGQQVAGLLVLLVFHISHRETCRGRKACLRGTRTRCSRQG